jgi:hypothetical protein
MSGIKIDRRDARRDAAVRRNDETIVRAAKRTDWAGTALEGAAGDLDGACDAEGNPLVGLTEAVQDEAERVVNLAEDIESRRTAPENSEPLVGPGPIIRGRKPR